ncbi:hypothetical protein E4U21_003081 [Claviceps maximensis]|nr:hypothetical protein E4U21_003081 [Claviceps maximensis]
MTIVILTFVAHRWTETCGPVAPGLVGTVAALFVDSWQMMAYSSTGQSLLGGDIEPMKPGTTIIYDALAFAITLGGISSMLVSSIVSDGEDDGEPDYTGGPEDPSWSEEGVYRRGDIRFRKSSLTSVSMWFLGSVM